MPPPEGQPPVQSPTVASTGCENCREQHLKCDRVTPSCGRCRLAGRQCRRAGIKIRVTKNSFALKQRWVKTPKRLVFIDETKEVAKDADDQGLEDADYDDGEPMVESSSSAAADIANQHYPPRHSRSTGRAISNVYEPAPGSPTDRFILREEGMMHDSSINHPSPSMTRTPSGDRPQIYLSEPVWPLNSASEARLFRHFVHKLAIWLDLCDPRRSFQTIVPQRAGTCPILLNAIFALAARHLSHIEDFDPLASNRYHEECLTYLIPMLNHAETVSDENLFAATIILRVLEEMEVKNMGTDNHGYLLGIHAFVKGRNRYLMPGSLSAACFWVGLRQEIYSAVMTHQPVRINLEHTLVDRSLEPADDCTWANRAVVHCADVLNFCFGQDGHFQPETMRWQELDEYGKRWAHALPPSFAPLYEEREGLFPEVWHQSSAHVIGLQHSLLAELFLTRFDPRMPRIGANRKVAEDAMVERIQTLVRRVCGIGLGNQWSPPGVFTACMAIAAFGDHFSAKRDQDFMLSILKTTERDHARPTESIQLMCR